jgi:tRNA pseudouridine38-40 synthase
MSQYPADDRAGPDAGAARNIRLLLEYDGARYAGWQAQPGIPTVQGVVAHAIKTLTGAEAALTGASRTDAGVHAFGQVANFKTSSRIPLIGVMRGLNSILPGDIAVKEASEAAPSFDARRDAKGKRYVYRIFNGDAPSPLSRPYSWHVSVPLDIPSMRRAAHCFIGEKDFSSFRASGSDAPHSVREVLSIGVEDRGGALGYGGAGRGHVEIEVRGTAFLRHMVRIIAGTLVAVGRGKLKPSSIPGIIEARDRRAAAMTAPPRGLFLMKVEY